MSKTELFIRLMIIIVICTLAWIGVHKLYVLFSDEYTGRGGFTAFVLGGVDIVITLIVCTIGLLIPFKGKYRLPT